MPVFSADRIQVNGSGLHTPDQRIPSFASLLTASTCFIQFYLEKGRIAEREKNVLER